MLGDEFFNQNRQARNSNGGSRSSSGATGAPVRRDSRGNAVAANDEAADLGILKALSSMGSAAKKNLSQLAERFSQGGAGAGTQTNANGNTGTAREFRPLVDSGNSFEVLRICHLLNHVPLITSFSGRRTTRRRATR